MDPPSPVHAARGRRPHTAGLTLICIVFVWVGLSSSKRAKEGAKTHEKARAFLWFDQNDVHSLFPLFSPQAKKGRVPRLPTPHTLAPLGAVCCATMRRNIERALNEWVSAERGGGVVDAAFCARLGSRLLPLHPRAGVVRGALGTCHIRAPSLGPGGSSTRRRAPTIGFSTLCSPPIQTAGAFGEAASLIHARNVHRCARTSGGLRSRGAVGAEEREVAATTGERI